METQLDKLVSEALKLTHQERAIFAQMLLSSLEGDAEDDDALEAEVERRVGDVESGLTPVISVADAIAKVRSTLK
jgi:putative addiction module component (TIGR02574 family)